MYKDIIVGTGPKAVSGSEVTVKYRVLRLGKRSRDGLSGGKFKKTVRM
jgi:hypothetical protein